MKKIAALILALVMMYTLSIPAFAALGAFVSSPGNSGAPSLEDFFNETPECFAELVITAYKDRGTLEDEKKTDLEKAYQDIVNATDLSTLNSSLADAAKALGVKTTDLAVSDLFDLSYYSCEHHEEHGGFTIKLKANTFKKFVKLMHYNGTSWEIIENATVNENDILTFTVKDFSPFAVVVNTAETSSPTGDSGIIFYVLLIVASAAGIVAVAYQAKKAR